MRAHNGMRPQDVVILLKIVSMGSDDWGYRDISSSLPISISEISESINRSNIAGLLRGKKVAKRALMEFIQFGFPYVFPVVPGAIVTGMPTAHSHPYFQQKILSDQPYVWPSLEGTTRGQLITPLHHAVVQGSFNDDRLYLLLASIDIIRVGKVREVKMALEALKEIIL